MDLTNLSAIPCIGDSVIIVRANSQSTWDSLPSSTILSSRLLAVDTCRDEKSSRKILAPGPKPSLENHPAAPFEPTSMLRSGSAVDRAVIGQRAGPGEIKALPPAHAEALERVELLGCLDALGDDHLAGVAAKGDERSGERSPNRIGVDGASELDVELDDVRTQSKDLLKAGVASAGVVDRDSARPAGAARRGQPAGRRSRRSGCARSTRGRSGRCVPRARTRGCGR